MMLTSLRYFLRSVLYWQELRRKKSGFYFLSATFPDEVWQILQEEIGLQGEDRIEGISYTGDVTLLIKPEKPSSGNESIPQDIEDLGIQTDLVGIFNSAYRAWQVCEAIGGLLFIGQDKLSEAKRRANFVQFKEDPELWSLIGSPAIEAGVDFVATNLVIEESDQDSFLQRFGRAARSGKNAFVLVYSDTLHRMHKEGLLKPNYTRPKFLGLLRKVTRQREPTKLFIGLAAYAYYNFWHQAPDFPMENHDRKLCDKLASKKVENFLAFRGLTPYTHYESGESISFKSLFRKALPVEDKKVRGAPHPEKYFKSPNRVPPVIAKVIGDIVEWDRTEKGQVMLVKVRFKNIDLGSHWVLLEITPTTGVDDRDDNIRLELGNGVLGRNAVDGSLGTSLVRFYDVDV